jgi:hypothetical protein
MYRQPLVTLVLPLGLLIASLFLLGSAPLPTHVAHRAPARILSPVVDPAIHPRVNQSLLGLPLRFIANAGQIDSAVQFTVKGTGHTIFFTPQGIIFSATRKEKGEPTRSVVRLQFTGANPQPTLQGLEPMPGRANFFIGSDPARWRANVATYGAVAYRDLYPGIDLVYRGTQGYLKSEYHLAPGADPALIEMAYAGLEGIHVRDDGALVLKTPLGELIESAPLIYQEVDGVRRSISGGYRLLPPRPGQDKTYRVRFQVGSYDPSQALVIDPTLGYATYLGGDSEDTGQAIAVDSQGHLYLTGYTLSSDYPTSTPTLYATHANTATTDVFVTQLINAAGVYTYGFSTYLGGDDDDYGFDIAVDDEGGVYVTGYTNSGNFPTHNAMRSNRGGSRDAFVTKIITAGGVYTFAYCSYLGGGGLDWAFGITLDGEGNALVTGGTGSSDFPVSASAIDTSWAGAGLDVFVTQIISASGAYTYGLSTYLGGVGSDQGHSIAVDKQGNTYVTGYASSGDFPVANATQPVYGGGTYDAFVTQIITASGAYTYGFSTYLGGGGHEWAYGVAVDGDGNVWITGSTDSDDFPAHQALQPTHANTDTYDAFVTHLVTSSGSYTYGYSSYLGGDNEDLGQDIAVDERGNAYVTGWTHFLSDGFPIHHAIQSEHGGSHDAFVTHIVGASGSYTYGYSTFLGENLDERGFGIAVDSARRVYVTGWTYSPNFYTTSDALDTSLGGSRDAFVARIDPIRIYLPIILRAHS